MARIRAPLHSTSATGPFGHMLGFASINPGRTIAKARRPNTRAATPAQIQVRNRMAATTAAQRWAARTAATNPEYGSTPLARWRALAPDPTEWENYLLRSLFGVNMTNIAAAESAWLVLTDEARAAWQAMIITAPPIIRPTPQAAPLGQPAAPLSAGFILWLHEWASWSAGLTASQPTATPPNYGPSDPLGPGSTWDAGASTWDGGASRWDRRAASIWDDPAISEWDGGASTWDYR